MDQPSSQATTTDKGESGVGPHYLLTNRFNLLGMLGSRLVAPRESFGKYYGDLLKRTPSRIPLITGAPDEVLLAEVTRDGSQAFPVLLRFDDLSDLPASRLSDHVVAVDCAIPLSRVTSIAFPDQRTLREHRARTYENIHPHDDILRVDPKLFSPPASTPGAEVLATLEAMEDRPMIDWRPMDRLRGAVSAVLAAANTPAALDVAARLLSCQPGASSPPAPWLTAAFQLHSPGALAKLDCPPAELLFFTTVLGVLADTDASVDWSPRRCLTAIKRAIDVAEPTKEDAVSIGRNLEVIRRVVANEIAFIPFNPKGSGLQTAKALLLFLLRNDLPRLLAWPKEETGADDAVFLTAAAFAGALRGLARESVSVRHVDVDDLTAAWVANWTGGNLALPSVEIKCPNDRKVLELKGIEVKEVTASAPTPESIYEGLEESVKPSARLEAAIHAGWDDMVETEIRVRGPVQLSSDTDALTIKGAGVPVVLSLVPEAVFLARLRDAEASARDKVAASLLSAREDNDGHG